MRNTFLILALIFCVNIVQAQLNQKSQRIKYFSGHTNPTYWDDGKSAAYFGGGANVTRSNRALPVETIDGIKAIKVESTMPSGWWNILFKIGVHEVNYNRMGNNPYICLRLKWTNIAAGADLDIEIQTYPDDKYITGNNTIEFASVRLSNYVTPSNNWQDVYIPVSDFLTLNPSLNLNRVPMLRLLGTGSYGATNTMYIEAMDIVPSIVDVYTDAVKINQIGYLPDQIKLGIVSFKPGAASQIPAQFEIVTVPGSSTVFTGNLVQQTPYSSQWGQDNDEVYHGDFSSLSSPGKYKMVVQSINQESQTFEIGKSVYDNVFRDALRFFYYSRSGEAIVEPYAEGFTRQAFYDNETNTPYAYTSGTRDVLGGWFDAGDLHKDVHANVESLWYLLETLKYFKEKNGADDLNIPESDANVNDLYYLIKYKLDWLIKMWNPDGSVHFWVDYAGHPADVSIGQVSDISSGSASALAGIFSKAYTLYKDEPVFSKYSNDLLNMAETSWQWLENNPGNVDPINPRTGTPYPYGMDADEDAAMRAFAAIELYDATGNSNYHEYFVNRYSDPLEDYRKNRSWEGIIQTLEHSYINLAYLDYANSSQPTVNTTIQNELKTEFIKLADWSMDRIGYTTYNIPLAAPNHLYWGSSGNIATYGYLYNQVYEWTNDANYKAAISNCVDWILGRNPVNRIFVTGYGDALHGTDIYSFFWADINNPPPGYLTGNINATDNKLKPYFEDPWKQYINMQQASILEPGIYWNAEFSWLMGYMASDKLPVVSAKEFDDREQSLTIYPNPSSDFFSVSKNFEHLEIFDTYGQVVLTAQGTSRTVDVSRLASGLYTVRVKTGNGVFNRKLIVH